MDFEDPDRSRLMEFCWKQLKTVDLQQRHVCEGQDEVLVDPEQNLSLDQEEPPQIKEEAEEVSSGQEAAPLVLKQEVRWKSESDENTSVWSEEDPDHQNQLLDPETQLHIIEVELQEEGPADQNRNSSLEPGPPQIKEDQEELCSRQQLVLRQRTGTLMGTCEEGDPEPSSHQLLPRVSPGTQSPDQSEPAGNTELTLKKRRHRNRSSSGSNRRSRTESAPESLICDVCGKTFRNKYKMKVHNRSHTGEKPHVCNICSKTFRESSDLTIHMRTHTGEKPYLCKVCGRGFMHSGGLTVHVRTHTGEKPYVCKVCRQTFRQSGTLSVHMRTHTGEKPYSCEICGKEFSRNDNLIIHMRTHTDQGQSSAEPDSVAARSHAGLKPFSCESCGKSFTHRSNLTVHMRTHTGEKPYSCGRCGKAFRHHSGWSVHTRTHTDKNLQP